MKRIYFLLFLCLFYQISTAQEVLKIIEGTVTEDLEPLANVNIIVKNTERGVKTDQAGKYRIQANEGEILVYSYIGKKTIEIVVEDVTEFLNIDMYDKINELDEVLLTKSKRKNQKDLFNEYNTNKNLIKTAYGILDKERSGFSMKIADGEDLILGGADFTFALSSLLPGIRIVRDSTSNPLVFLPRRFSSFSAPRSVLFDVEGNIFTNTPVFIQTENIERIAIINSAGAIARYGTLAAGGLIIINTKSNNFSPTESEGNLPYDQAKLRNNFYVKDPLSNKLSLPRYLTDLQKTSGKEEAEQVYKDHQALYGHFPHYHLDAMSFFLEKLDDRAMFDKISRQIEDRFASNPTVLKALAFKYEAIGNYEMTKELYKKVLVLRPHYPQSYMNLANSYNDLGNPEQAATLFARYIYLVDEGFFQPSKIFENIMERNFNNLLKSDGLLLSGNKKVIKTKEDDFKGTRLVFEWNDGEAEFELQFVNPDGQYSTWKHTLADEPERISDEKNTGFSCEEKLIYDPSGVWQVNVKYLGNKSLTPAYLKAEIYYNYGTKEQRKEVKVFKLSAKNINQELFSIQKNQLITNG